MKKEGVFRILDVNLNRAGEGLRVIEDIVRFVEEDEVLYGRLRRIRHGITGVLREAYPQLIFSRDSEKDIALPRKEKKRRNTGEIAYSNFRRVEEALRVLEEFSKLVSGSAGYRFKRLRFRVYAVEKEYFRKLKA